MGYPFVLLKLNYMTANMGSNTTSSEKENPRGCACSHQKKMGCPAHILVKEYHLYPDFLIKNIEQLKGHEVKALKKKRHAEINGMLPTIKIEKKYCLSLPMKLTKISILQES